MTFKYERELATSMFDFQATDYGVFSELLCGLPLPELGPGNEAQQQRTQLKSISSQSLSATDSVVDTKMEQCCVSGLWLAYDFLDESHQISQDIDTPTGSYWHGIMHRREPDFGNSKYWFRRVGEHPIFPTLCEAAGELARNETCGKAERFLAEQTTWDPFQFVDLCQAVLSGLSQAESLCRNVAQLEWQILFDFCYRSALGK